ncbi:hypothetical protein PG997_006371 [Apiospora hydei]|uniref:Bacteriophage T5 Orf172 DNA-binding domain-containing protein n=1 Tax=Apiospora hydei TaxID=1337664 RepID=A0ABR1WRF5_9PEZI
MSSSLDVSFFFSFYEYNPIEDDDILPHLTARWKNEILQQRGLPSSVQVSSGPRLPLPEFRPRMRDPGPKDSVSYKISDRLVNRDVETGSLYIFSRSSSPGYVKIGWTARGVQGRLDDWAECGYKPNLLFQVDDVPHAQRVETLTHCELIKEWRKERPCKGPKCGGKEHQEWFEISRERAILVLGLWAGFMSKVVPYDWSGSLKLEWRQYVKQAGKVVTARHLWEHHSASLARREIRQTVTDDTDRVTYVKVEEQKGDSVHATGESIGSVASSCEVKEEEAEEEEEDDDDRLYVVEDKRGSVAKKCEEEGRGGRQLDMNSTEKKSDTDVSAKTCKMGDEKEGGQGSPKNETEKDDILHPEEETTGAQSSTYETGRKEKSLARRWRKKNTLIHEKLRVKPAGLSAEC